MKASELRKSILQAAVQGKLVSQNPQDEPASELFKRIQAEKEQLIKDKKLKKEKPLPAITEEEIPFELPQGWIWCRLGDLTSKIGAGSTPTGGRNVYKTSGYKLIRSQNVYNDGLRLDNVAYIDSVTHDKMEGASVYSGDILLNITGASIGRCCIVPKSFDVGHVNQHVIIIRPLASNICKYLHNVLVSNYIQQTIMDIQVGVSREGLSGVKLKNFLIPLPPLEEQKRIVAKVDELMALCDELEKAEKTADNLDKNFFSNLPKSILQSAIKGELVPQCPTDESASELFKRIQAEKEQFIKDKKLKKEKPLPAITEEEIPFELPQGWIWCRLGDLTSKIGAGSTPTGGRNVYKTSGYKLIRSQNVYNDGLRLDNVAYIDSVTHDKMEGASVYSGDILLNITGASIGRCCIVPKSFDVGHVNQHVIIIRPLASNICKYLHNVLVSNYIQQTIMDIQVGVSREGLSGVKLKNFLIPLPPLEEQKRIVAKVDELMALCEGFKAL